MSDNHNLTSNPCVSGEVDHSHLLSWDIGNLYQDKEYSDVTLVVEDVEFHCHKVILAARSEYFRALLFGGMRESQQNVIELKETNVNVFKIFIKYIYTGNLLLAKLKEEMILEILGLAHHYNIVDLESAISDYLQAILNIKNICIIFDTAKLYQLSSLIEMCLTFMDRHAVEIIQHESFLSLSPIALKSVITRDSFCAPEIDIFRAVKDWTQQNTSDPVNRLENINFILQAIRLPLMSLPDLLNIVRPSKLMSPDNILDAIKSRLESKDIDLKYRGCLMPEENVVSAKHGAHLLTGEFRSALLDGDLTNYDMEKGFTRHHIDEDNGQGILIKLGMQCLINHMSLLLWDKDVRSYSYYIEISMDMKDWVKIIDHTQYLCRSWQKLYFPMRVARYVRIVGTHNTINRVFHLVSFSCMYTYTKYRLGVSGLVVPTKNVAHISENAIVIEGVSRSRNALLNGDTENYDWDTGYTCHQLGSGAIVIQLAQPYIIGSCRLLLWDIDDRNYSYYIEVSLDQITWDRIVDKSKEKCRSWQTMTFEEKPVTFIRIVGCHNSANEVFHCVHFECPAQIDLSSIDSSQNDSSFAESLDDSSPSGSND